MELLIATLLLGIVMVGIASVDYAANQVQLKSSRSAILAMRTSATLLDISKNAGPVMGDQNNSGVSGNCFRQDLNATPTPSIYTDDSWICYTIVSNAVYKCTRASAGACTSADENIGAATALAVSYAGDRTLGTQNSYIDISITNVSIPTVAVSQENPQLTLTTRVVPAFQSY